MIGTVTKNGHEHKNGTGNPVPASSGRDANGRFAPGNKLGTGNPFARLVAGLRQRFINRVSPADLDELVDTLLLLAKGGDLGAMKLVLGYLLGKPAEVVNPDTLDLDEWKIRKQAPPREEAEAVMARVPLELVNAGANAMDLVQWQMAAEEIETQEKRKPARQKDRAGHAPPAGRATATYSPRSISAGRLTAALGAPARKADGGPGGAAGPARGRG